LERMYWCANGFGGECYWKDNGDRIFPGIDWFAIDFGELIIFEYISP
jgi:hypothetical protein